MTTLRIPIHSGVYNNDCHTNTIIIEEYVGSVVSGIAYCNGTKHTTGQYWTFNKHVFHVIMEGVNFPTEETKTFTWELKNVTKSVVIDSGTWQYSGKGSSSFFKDFIVTQNYCNDLIRLTVTVTLTPQYLVANWFVNTVFT
jgi:hypothetical protein